MPQPGLPLTPGPSTELSGKENVAFSQSDALFSLPPSATEGKGDEYAKGSRKNSTTAANPPTPKHETANDRSRNNTSVPTTSDVSLPPPPTRSRKIIQMKPKTRQTNRGKQTAQPNEQAVADKQPQEEATPSAAKKKGGNSGGSKTSKKVARKTAHSLIERRRRSKMNEEFATLKDMIPACSGQDMHKLAILQAGIDYVRYLEQCVTDLKAGATQRSESETSRLKDGELESPPDSADYEEEDSDQEMEDVNQQGIVQVEQQQRKTSSPSLSGSTAIASPPFPAVESYPSRQFSQASGTELLSPALSAQYAMSPRNHGSRQSWSSYAGSVQTSPMVLPQDADVERSKAIDHEASAALLLLNSSDRRNSATGTVEVQYEKNANGRRTARGMSVKDLLRN